MSGEDGVKGDGSTVEGAGQTARDDSGNGDSRTGESVGNGASGGNGGSSDNGGSNGGSGKSASGDGDDNSGDQSGPSAVQMAVMGISAAFTLALIAYAGWQIAAAPGATVPEASVIDTEPMAEGAMEVTVGLNNPQDVGLVSATVQSNCTSPPVQVQLSYVPASASRTATFVCPPGTTDPNASVASWVSR